MHMAILYKRTRFSWLFILLQHLMPMVQRIIRENISAAQQSVEHRGLMFPVDIFTEGTLLDIAEDVRNKRGERRLRDLFRRIDGRLADVELVIVDKVVLRIHEYIPPVYEPFDIAMIMEGGREAPGTPPPTPAEELMDDEE